MLGCSFWSRRVKPATSLLASSRLLNTSCTLKRFRVLKLAGLVVWFYCKVCRKVLLTGLWEGVLQGSEELGRHGCRSGNPSYCDLPNTPTFNYPCTWKYYSKKALGFLTGQRSSKKAGFPWLRYGMGTSNPVQVKTRFCNLGLV